MVMNNNISIHKKISNSMKSLVARIVLFVLYRGIKVLAREDSRIMGEFQSWPDGLSVVLETSYNGPSISLQNQDHFPFNRRSFPGTDWTDRCCKGLCRASFHAQR